MPTTTNPKPRCCRRCGCTDTDCSKCIKRIGRPCYWVTEDLCSACVRIPVDPWAGSILYLSHPEFHRTKGGR